MAKATLSLADLQISGGTDGGVAVTAGAGFAFFRSLTLFSVWAGAAAPRVRRRRPQPRSRLVAVCGTDGRGPRFPATSAQQISRGSGCRLRLYLAYVMTPRPFLTPAGSISRKRKSTVMSGRRR